MITQTRICSHLVCTLEIPGATLFHAALLLIKKRELIVSMFVQHWQVIPIIVWFVVVVIGYRQAVWSNAAFVHEALEQQR